MLLYVTIRDLLVVHRFGASIVERTLLPATAEPKTGPETGNLPSIPLSPHLGHGGGSR